MNGIHYYNNSNNSNSNSNHNSSNSSSGSSSTIQRLGIIAILLLLHLVIVTGEAFVPPNCYTNQKWSRQHTQNALSSSLIVLHNTQAGAEDTTMTQPKTDLPGVTEFENWFYTKCCDNNSNNNTPKYVRHSMFANGRGLELIVTRNGKNVWSGKEIPVITVPQDVVLSSVYVEDKESLESIADDWDVVLALKLLKECQKGRQSDIYGYCMLLTRGQDFASAFPTPPSTAPHCIRNWTDSQKKRLLASTRGERLLRIQEKQSQEWMEKYAALSPEDRNMFTREQFFWAMEAVYSRAFKGDFGGLDAAGGGGGGGNVLKQLSKALVPFAAAALALNYVQTTPFDFLATADGGDGGDGLTSVLLALSCAPVVLNFISDRFGKKQIDAVLLPFVDNANHLEEAQSRIEYDPLKGVFTVSVEGRNCIVLEKDKNGGGGGGSSSSGGSGSGRKQFYISYGPKRESELLLNYGFLPEVSLDVYSASHDDNDDEEEVEEESKRFDEIRQTLADCYNTGFQS